MAPLGKSRPGNHLQLPRCKRRAKEVQGQGPAFGGNTLYLAPGWRLSKGSWSSFVPAGFAIVNDLDSIQSEPVVRVVREVSIAS